METDNFITENIPSKRLKTWGSKNEDRDIFIQCLVFNPIPPGLFEGGAAGGGGGGKCPRPVTLKLIMIMK